MKLISRSITNFYLFNLSKQYSIKHTFFSIVQKHTFLVLRCLTVNTRYFSSLCDLILFGLIKGYSFCIELHGSGYKFKLINVNNWFGLILRVGYSHLICIDLYKNIRTTFLSKTMLCFYSHDLFFLKNQIESILLKRKLNVYKGKGLFFKHSVIMLKKNKKLKF
jgi:ribosomal protein L6P/L9E